MQPISIVLIDDQPLFVEGFRAFCARSPNVKLVATAASISDTARIAQQYAPDIVFIDVAVADCSSEALAALVKRTPAKVVALTACQSLAFAIQTLNSGAFGYVLKQSSGDEIQSAIEAIARGDKFITHGFSNKLVAALQDATLKKAATRAINLSIRENQIVRLLLDGKTNKEIALILAITENTVKHYMSLLMQKLNARNRLEVVIAAQKLAMDERTGDSLH
jgi:DNA-binding NarL/FixJ family response regulator